MNNVGRQLINTASSLKRFVPVANHASNINFSQVLGTVGSVAQTALGGASSILSGNGVSIDPVYQNFLEKQMYFQEQMLQVSLVSNIEKAAHDTKMAPVRNIRVS